MIGQDDLSPNHSATWPQDPHQFTGYSRFIRGKIEESIDDHSVNALILDWECFC
jgi:hypothetical protein